MTIIRIPKRPRLCNPIPLVMPVDQLRRIDALAVRHNLPRSTVMRMAMVKGLSHVRKMLAA